LNSVNVDTLNGTVFSNTSPGSLLADIELLLAEAEQAGIPLSPKTKRIAMGQLARLNESLAMPYQVSQTRPLQESFPNINGLYLLLRISGLTRVRKKGNKKFLVVNEAAAGAWKELNHEEKYVSLLKYFLFASHEMIDRFSKMIDSPVAKGIDLFSTLGPSFTKVKGDKDKELSLTYRYGTYFVALLHQFGFVEITQGKTKKGEKWFPAKIRKTKLGEAFGKLLEETLESVQIYDSERVEVNQLLTDMLTPYFSGVKNLLCEVERQAAKFHDGVYLFKVKLQRFSCRIAVPATATFADFAHAILKAVKFDNDHLYSFEFENNMGGDIRVTDGESYSQDFSSYETTIGDVSLYEGAEIRFLFDFGDCWEFVIDLETINAPDKRMKKPKITDQRGTPPEQYPDDDWF